MIGANDILYTYYILYSYTLVRMHPHTHVPLAPHMDITSCRMQDSYCGWPGRVFCTGNIPSCTKPDEPEWYAKLANPLCMHCSPKRFQYIIIMVIILYKWYRALACTYLYVYFNSFVLFNPYGILYNDNVKNGRKVQGPTLLCVQQEGVKCFTVIDLLNFNSMINKCIQ